MLAPQIVAQGRDRTCDIRPSHHPAGAAIGVSWVRMTMLGCRWSQPWSALKVASEHAGQRINMRTCNALYSAESDGLAWPLGSPGGGAGPQEVDAGYLRGTSQAIRVTNSAGGLLSRWLGGDAVGGPPACGGRLPVPGAGG